MLPSRVVFDEQLDSSSKKKRFPCDTDRASGRAPPLPPAPAELFAAFFSFAAACRRECDRERVVEGP